jgi:hypothetical protein
MCRQRLDARDRFPSGMEDYLSAYGWHFNKKMAEWAVSNMRKKADANSDKLVKMQMTTKEQLDELMKKHNIIIEDINGYDAMYLYNMIKADYFGSSIVDEQHALLHIKDIIEDPDGYESKAFSHFYVDCISMGIPIIWEDMI